MTNGEFDDAVFGEFTDLGWDDGDKAFLLSLFIEEEAVKIPGVWDRLGEFLAVLAQAERGWEGVRRLTAGFYAGGED